MDVLGLGAGYVLCGKLWLCRPPLLRLGLSLASAIRSFGTRKLVGALSGSNVQPLRDGGWSRSYTFILDHDFVNDLLGLGFFLSFF